TGYRQEVLVAEGERVCSAGLVARLDMPDLASKTAQKRAEVQETQAKLRLLEAGPRQEEISEQRHRVDRAKEWRDLAEKDLARTRQTLAEDLSRLDQQIAQHRAEVEYAEEG